MVKDQNNKRTEVQGFICDTKKFKEQNDKILKSLGHVWITYLFSKKKLLFKMRKSFHFNNEITFG